MSLALLASGLATLFVARRASGLLAVALWLSALGLLMAAFAGEWRAEVKGRFRLGRVVFVLALVLAPCVVRMLVSSPNRISVDEFVEGYFSLHEDLSPARFFEHVPQKGDWAGERSTLFFVIQKRLLGLFGDDIRGLRLSVQPYVLLSALFLYLTAARLLGRLAAVFAVLFYASFSMSVYIETMALEPLPCAAVLCGAFYFALRMTSEQPLAADAVAAGAFTALCYLFYYESFVALGILGAFVLLHLWRDRRTAFRQAVLAAIGFAIVIAPFVAGNFRSITYFDRFRHVSLFGGQGPMGEGASASAVLRQSLRLSFRSLFEEGIGGKGAFEFGHVAFFDPLSLGLFAAGLVGSLLLIGRARGIGLVLLTIAVSFLFGVVLTTPGPAFQRFSGAFPFLALVFAVPLSWLFRSSRLSVVTKVALGTGVLALFAQSNATHFLAATRSEWDSLEEFRLASYINSRFPDRTVYVAAHGGAGYEKVAYFATPPRRANTVTSNHRDLIAAFRPWRRYVYVVLFPENFQREFQALDPNGHWFRFSSGWGVFFNERTSPVVIPGATALAPLPAPHEALPGLSLTVFGNNAFSGPGSVTTTQRLGFACDPSPYDERQVSLRYQGWLRATDGAYIVRITSDDESWLRLNGEDVLKQLKPGGAEEVPLSLVRGFYAFQLDYRNNAGRACLKVEWSEDGGDTFREMPAGWFYR